MKNAPRRAVDRDPNRLRPCRHLERQLPNRWGRFTDQDVYASGFNRTRRVGRRTKTTTSTTDRAAPVQVLGRRPHLAATEDRPARQPEPDRRGGGAEPPRTPLRRAGHDGAGRLRIRRRPRRVPLGRLRRKLDPGHAGRTPHLSHRRRRPADARRRPARRGRRLQRQPGHPAIHRCRRHLDEPARRARRRRLPERLHQPRRSPGDPWPATRAPWPA
jgi:hypothetical protein